MSELSRIETLLGALVDGETVDVIPQSRIETYLLALLNGDTEVKEPQSRIEAYLYQLCKRGMSGGGITSTGLVYELAEPVTFNGTSDYIDTGVKLYDTDKDFLILLEFENPTSENMETLLHCMIEVEPWTGVTIKAQGNLLFSVVGTTVMEGYLTQNGVTRIALARRSGYYLLEAMYDGSINPQIVSEGDVGFGPIQNTLLLGAYQDNNGVKGRFWSGTISKCKVFVGADLPSANETYAFLIGESV